MNQHRFDVKSDWKSKMQTQKQYPNSHKTFFASERICIPPIGWVINGSPDNFTIPKHFPHQLDVDSISLFLYMKNYSELNNGYFMTKTFYMQNKAILL